MKIDQPMIGHADIPHTVMPVKGQGLSALIALSILFWIAVALFADAVS
ncbi:hypothetical protein PQ455_02460 [Sphingomonas naphthae]|uniref:Uncharacterized protein n=1 Tax=Sphingomonas naphthae TaxID=1813468 RepID=A0ABY7TPJ8_9SPHN|nr:hypothetical protein [Sphingomonas naphthae]WCT74114.1 hypothetical protein PQ455_02460 [Sphingomonas naphthae]